MKNTYFINYDLSGDFNIIFNGISLNKNKKEGVIMNYEYLNPHISQSGEQTITLSLKALDKSQKLNPKILNDIFLEVYLSTNGEQPPFKKIHILKLPQYKETQDSIIHTWSFNAEVPFEINELSNATDLTKEDPDKLLQEILEKYKKVHSLINEGNINEYVRLYKKSLGREMISMYYDESKQKEYLDQMREFISQGENHMVPLQNYKIYINPNGKIVELENPEGKPILVSENEKSRHAYGLQLYRSSKTGKLEIY